MMFHSEMSRRRFSDLRFIIFPLRKPDGERLHFLPDAADEARQQRVGIKATAQQQTDRNVAAKPKSDTFVELRSQRIKRFIVTANNFLRLVERPVTLHIYLARLPDQVVRGGQFFNLFYDGLRRGNEP